MTEQHVLQLEKDGYAILPGFMSNETLEELRARVDELYRLEGAAAGSEFRQEPNTRRLANLVDKGRIFREIIVIPEILDLVTAVLGPDFKLSSLNARSANPNSDSGQPLHTDMGLLADEKGYSVCNTVWMLDDFTAENGALRVIPGSHQWRKLPQDTLDNPSEPYPGERLITGTAGTVVVMNAHAWHGGTANRTDRERRAVHGFYCRGDVGQQQYQKALLRPETQRELTHRMRAILALDDPRNDVLSSAMERRSGFLK